MEAPPEQGLSPLPVEVFGQAAEGQHADEDEAKHCLGHEREGGERIRDTACAREHRPGGPGRQRVAVGIGARPDRRTQVIPVVVEHHTFLARRPIRRGVFLAVWVTDDLRGRVVGVMPFGFLELLADAGLLLGGRPAR